MNLQKDLDLLKEKKGNFSSYKNFLKIYKLIRV